MEPDTGGVCVDVSSSLGVLRVRVCGTGRPVLLWHSLFVDSTTWEPVRAQLAAHHRLIIVDGPCHGDSEALRRDFTMGQCAEVAVEVLDQLGVTEPVDWVGNAWGGHVGVLFAAAHPARCRSLVMVGTPLRSLSGVERVKATPMVALYRLLGPVRPLVKAVEDALLGEGAPRRDAQVISQAVLRSNRRGMYTAMRSVMLRRPDLTAALASASPPGLVVAADQDRMWSPHEAELAAAQTGCGFATLPGAGHVAPLLQTAPALCALLERFWSGADQQSSFPASGHPGALAG